MAVLYQVEEQGRQTAFVGEKEGGFTELHSLLERASAIVEVENSGFAEALSNAAAERGTCLLYTSGLCNPSTDRSDRK